MKLVDLQYIVANTRKLAAVKETLSHMQDAYKEIVGALCRGFILDGGPSTVTILYGCVNSGTVPDYNISAGYVFNNGEVFEVPAFSGTAVGLDVPVLSLDTSYIASDPARYKKADGTFENINTHSIRKLLWSFAPIGSGITQFAACHTLKSWIVLQLGDTFASQGAGQVRLYTNLNVIGNPASTNEIIPYPSVFLPQGGLVTDGRDRLKIKLFGSYGGNNNAGKEIRIALAGFNLIQTSTSANGVSWNIEVEAIRVDNTTLRIFRRWEYDGKTEVTSQVISINTFDFSINQLIEVGIKSASVGAANDVTVQGIVITIDPV